MALRLEPLNRSIAPAGRLPKPPGVARRVPDAVRLAPREKDLLAGRICPRFEAGSPRLAGVFQPGDGQRRPGGGRPAARTGPTAALPIRGFCSASRGRRARPSQGWALPVRGSAGLTLQLAQTGRLAFRLFVTDALDRKWRTFTRIWLRAVGRRFPCRMVLDLRPCSPVGPQPEPRVGRQHL